MKQRIELNLTLACNYACPSCDRLCNRFPNRTSHMTLDQIDKLCLQLQEAKGKVDIQRVKVVGGEPLLHPEYPEVHNRLCKAVDNKLIHRVKIQSNGILPIPEGLVVNEAIRFSGKVFRKRRHLPIWAPSDFGLSSSLGCKTLSRCGMSLDSYGWLPCSPAIAIVGVFGLEYLYRDKLLLEPWGLDELCFHCVYSGPKEWQALHLRSFNDMDKEHRMPSASWMSRLDSWDGLPDKELW